MSDCIKVEIDADKGATLISPNFFSVEETIEPNATIADIERGIATGKYTVVDPNLYTYQGMIKASYDQKTLVNLNIFIEDKDFEHEDPDSTDTNPLPPITGTYQVVKFKVLPDVTSEWKNKDHTLLFDIKRTEIADTTNVDVWVKGKINVEAVVTE